MASKSGAVWAIDIGSNSLKALHLSAAGDTVEVIGFANIQHGKILTGDRVKAAERDELIALSLREFVKQNNLGKDDVIISVPGQNSFARFVTLPPVESKRIPEIVKFEAAQQIPFDIDDVQWDWQLMTEAGSSEVKVGIFAIKNDIVHSELEHFGRENIQVRCVQMAPMALYNYLLYDRPGLTKSSNQATVVLNIGAESTDLVVCISSTVWQRGIPMGGNAFTRAIAEAFRLNFEKAEKLKRTAPMSKYARQIFQAMRPVFADLASEIQRSLGFYTSSNPEVKLSKIIALGGGTKMRGLLKYFQQSLRIPVEVPDSFKNLAISSSVSAAQFHENVCDFGIVYGLALQGLDLARIESNLLPRSVARSMSWASKARYFIAAACVLLLVSVMCLVRTTLDSVNYARNDHVRGKVSSIINMAKQAGDKLDDQEKKGPEYDAVIQKEFGYFKHRDVVALLHQTIISVLPNKENNPEQKELYKAFGEGRVEDVLEISRKERKQMFITSMSVRFVDDVSLAKFDDVVSLKSKGATRRSRTGRRGGGAPGAMMSGGFGGMTPGGQRGGRTSSRRSSRTDGSEEQDEIEKGQGFVVTISGYSPYKNIGELMDPAGVEDERDGWGVVTRLLHLDDIVDGNSPFKLYNKTSIEHFKLEIGGVDLDTEMPRGIGIEDVRFERAKVQKGKQRRDKERVLVDPMTKEIISKVAKLDEYGAEVIDRSGNIVYEVNDHWFILNVKFVWADALKKIQEADD